MVCRTDVVLKNDELRVPPRKHPEASLRCGSCGRVIAKIE